MIILTSLNPLFPNTLTFSTLSESSTIIIENLKPEQLKSIKELKREVSANMVPKIVVERNKNDNNNEGD